jgi:hypothetical protein
VSRAKRPRPLGRAHLGHRLLRWRAARLASVTPWQVENHRVGARSALIARFGTLGRVPTPFLLRSDIGLVVTSRSYTTLRHPGRLLHTRAGAAANGYVIASRRSGPVGEIRSLNTMNQFAVLYGDRLVCHVNYATRLEHQDRYVHRLRGIQSLVLSCSKTEQGHLNNRYQCVFVGRLPLMRLHPTSYHAAQDRTSESISRRPQKYR